MRELIAQSPFGIVDQPEALERVGGLAQGPGNLLTLVIRVLIVGAGIFAVINFVLAGYAFLAAGDDPKKIEGAWAKIWQSIIGLVVAAASIVIAALIGRLVFGEWDSILRIRLPVI